MIRLALPKGRNLDAALAAFRAAGIGLDGLDGAGRSLRTRLPEEGIEVLSLKDWDLPLYVSHGIADCGIVGSDVLEEVDGDLLVPVRLLQGRSRLSFIGREAALPAPGTQVRLATKYPNTARRIVAERSWGAEIVKLSGSIELAPILRLAELALDIVQTGRTLAPGGDRGRSRGLRLPGGEPRVVPAPSRAPQRLDRPPGGGGGGLVSPIEVFKPKSRAGRRAVERLVRRGDAVLDPRTLRKTAEIVRDVRRKGDRALLDYARKLDGATAESAAGLALAPTMEDPADLPVGFAEALERAIAAVERFHAPQRRTGYKVVDEEGEEGQDEATVRPWEVSDAFDPSAGMFIIRAAFALADRTKMQGYMTPPLQGDNSLGTLQPVIVTERGQVFFWCGMLAPDAQKLAQNYQKLGRDSEEVFPVQVISDIELLARPISSQIPGFIVLEDPVADKIRIVT